MKRILSLFLLFFYMSSLAQSHSEKYNSLLKRYEYYNDQGQIIGYKIYDIINRQWEYTDLSQTKSGYDYPPITSSINLPLIQQVMSTKQNQYNSNLSSINNYINELRTLLNNSSFNEESKIKIKQKFNSQYLEPMHAKGFDFSNYSLTNQILQWLKDGFDNVVFYENEFLKKEKQSELILNNQIANEIAYHSGAYTTTSVTDEKYNPYTKKYEFIKIDNSISKVYIDGVKNQIYYLRSYNDDWRFYNWRYDNSTVDFYELIDETNGCVMQVSKKFDGIIFYEEKVGDIYTKRYLYRNLKKDNLSTYKP